MSPSTKNLREKLIRIMEDCPCSTPAEKQAEEILSLLSSELSLAVKGLRDAIEKRSDEDDQPGEWGGGTRYGYQLSLEVFDSKAKEILGESS